MSRECEGSVTSLVHGSRGSVCGRKWPPTGETLSLDLVSEYFRSSKSNTKRDQLIECGGLPGGGEMMISMGRESSSGLG